MSSKSESDMDLIILVERKKILIIFLISNFTIFTALWFFFVVFWPFFLMKGLVRPCMTNDQQLIISSITGLFPGLIQTSFMGLKSCVNKHFSWCWISFCFCLFVCLFSCGFFWLKKTLLPFEVWIDFQKRVFPSAAFIYLFSIFFKNKFIFFKVGISV
jgi:hypothetical protein